MKDLIGLAERNNSIYLAAYNAGLEEGLKRGSTVRSRLEGAIEDYLDGEMQNNVSGLRRALASSEESKKAARRIPTASNPRDVT